MKQPPHIAVLSSNGSDSKLLGATSLDRGTGLQQAQAIEKYAGCLENIGIVRSNVLRRHSG